MVSKAYQNGFKTERQGCLHVTGSNCSSGVSAFSFSGVYSAPIGTTSLDASCIMVSRQAYPKSEDNTRHACTWKHVPAEADAIAVFDLAPLLLESFVIHLHRTIARVGLISEYSFSLTSRCEYGVLCAITNRSTPGWKKRHLVVVACLLLRYRNVAVHACPTLRGCMGLWGGRLGSPPAWSDAGFTSGQTCSRII